MSETKCKCGYPIRFLEAEEGENERPAMWIHTGGYGRQCPIYAEPAEPVIEVAPNEPTCEYCGPACYRGAEHNARVEDGARYTDDPVPGEPTRVALNRCPGCDEYGASHTTPSIEHPAVPAQEAPRDHNARPFELSGKAIAAFSSVIKALASAEPQAGAQVPSPDYKEMWLKAVDLGLTQHIIKVRENTKLREELGRVNTHLNSIKSYATEAAKTPITREDMHDPLKAQTFFDEAKGFERLVMSEINPKGKS